eukprot:142027_1
MLPLVIFTSIIIYACGATYNISSWKITIANTMNHRDRAQIPLDIYYPTISQSDNTKFPILIFGHCLTGKERYYDYVWQSAVPNGYIVILPRRLDDTKDEKPLARDMRYTLDWIIDNCTNCPFRHMMNGKSFVSGHSMGAGSGLFIMGDYWLGESFKYQFDAGMLLAACGGWTEQLEIASKNVTNPIIFFDGSHDCIAPTWEYADVYFDNLPDTNACQYEIIITNGTHCNFAELDSAEESGCLGLEEGNCINATMTGYIPQNIQLEISMKYMNMFMNATLYDYNNTNAYAMLNQMLEKDYINNVVAKSVNNNHCN